MRRRLEKGAQEPFSPLLISPRSLGALYRRDLLLLYNSGAVAIASVAGRLHFRPQPVLRGDQEPPPPQRLLSLCARALLSHYSVWLRWSDPLRSRATLLS